MGNDIKREPQVRFIKYTITWEQRKLGDEATEIVAGGDIDKKLICEEGDYPVIANALTNDGIVGYYNSKYRIKGPAVSVTGRGDIGHAKARNVDFTPVVRLLTIKSEHDVFFLENAINTLRIVVESTGVPQLTVPQLSRYRLYFPKTYDEERMIGMFLRNLDNLITLHQQKLNNIKELEKSLLQKMFPKVDEKIPVIRFYKFTDDWNQLKLGKLTKVYDGTHQTPDYKTKGIMFLSVENIKTLKSDKYISKDAFQKEFKIRPEKDDILMTRIGNVGTANVISLNEPVAYYVSLALLKKKELNPYFLKASIHSPMIQNEIWRRTLHVAFPKKINKYEIEEIPVNFPNAQEQQQIGNLFIQLDNLIDLHQQKLKKLQDMKKSMLKKMFI